VRAGLWIGGVFGSVSGGGGFGKCRGDGELRVDGGEGSPCRAELLGVLERGGEGALGVLQAALMLLELEPVYRFGAVWRPVAARSSFFMRVILP